jgi:hypothetical protein
MMLLYNLRRPLPRLWPCRDTQSPQQSVCS